MMGALHALILSEAYLRKERSYVSFQPVGPTTGSTGRAGKVKSSCVKLKDRAPVAQAATAGRVATLLIESERQIAGWLDDATGRHLPVLSRISDHITRVEVHLSDTDSHKSSRYG